MPNTENLVGTLPPKFINNVHNSFRAEGAQWLRDLPHILDKVITAWDLTKVSPFENLSYNFVSTVYCRRYSQMLVLKCGIPNKEFISEMAALNYYHGSGTPNIIESLPSLGAFLMEQVSPGVALKISHENDDEGAVDIAARVIKRLHSINKNEQKSLFPTIRQWHASLYDTKPYKNLSFDVLNSARNRLEHLIDSQEREVLLHGDLHHDNILSSQTHGFVAIDPKGVLGDPAFEVGTFMRNPFPELMARRDVPRILLKRIEKFSLLLALDKQRLLDASIAQIVLSACWYREANNEEMMQADIRCAEHLMHLGF